MLVHPCYRLSLRLPEYDDVEPFNDDGSFQVSSVDPWEELRPSIKVLEITGFGLGPNNCFLEYVLRHFTMLEKLIFDSRSKPLDMCISHWRSMFLSTVEFVVLERSKLCKRNWHYLLSLVCLPF